METKTKRATRPLQSNITTSLREGFTTEERKELQYAISITDYIKKKGIIV